MGNVRSERMHLSAIKSGEALRIRTESLHGVNSAIETKDRFGSEAAAQKNAGAASGN